MKNSQKNNLVYVDQWTVQQKYCVEKKTFEKFNANQLRKIFKPECQESNKDFDNADDDTLTGMLIW